MSDLIAKIVIIGNRRQIRRLFFLRDGRTCLS
jgi:hypothetical protein